MLLNRSAFEQQPEESDLLQGVLLVNTETQSADLAVDPHLSVLQQTHSKCILSGRRAVRGPVTDD